MDQTPVTADMWSGSCPILQYDHRTVDASLLNQQTKPHFNAVFLTDTGYRRDHNEDSGVVNRESAFFAVADGLGGHQAGEIASSVCCQEINAQVTAGIPLETSIQLAHEKIYEVAHGNNMGTTLVTLQLIGNRYEIGWVGDSRVYLLRQGLTQLTTDHSLVQELVDSGELAHSAAESSSIKNILSQALGLEGNIEPETCYGEIEKGDVFLLCSDGLTNELSDSQIERWLRQGVGVDEIARGLVNDALAAGGKDNVTVVIVRVESAAKPDQEDVDPMMSKLSVSKTSSNKNIYSLMAIGSGLALFAAAVLVWFVKGS